MADLREFLVVTKITDLVQTSTDLEDKSVVHLVLTLMLMLTPESLTLEDLVDMDPFLEDPEVTEDTVGALSVVKAVDLETMVQIFTVDMLEALPEPMLTPTLMPMPMPEPPAVMELFLEDLEVTEDSAKAHSMATVAVDVHNVALPV